MRTALVGGGAAGIGRATATRLAAAGYRVVLAGRTEESLAKAAVDVGTDGGYVVGDVADPSFPRRAVAEVTERHGSLDVLVCNSGGPRPGGILEIDDDTWRSAYELLVLGPLRLAREAMPAMAARGFGRVEVVTSTAVRAPQPGLAASTVLRSATTAMAALLALEYAAYGVTVNCVAPGATDTARRRQILTARAEQAGTDYDAAAAKDSAAIPAGRAADPDEIGAAVAFLCSADASYVNGTVLTVDGGSTRAPW